MKIGLSGASGRMGQSIKEVISNQKACEILFFYDQKNPLTNWKPALVDVVIDFSNQKNFSSILHWCVQNKKPLVSGTTGLIKEDQKEINKASQEIPVLWAANMSLGIAFFNEMLKNIPEEIKNWKVTVEETHHQFKKDKPSGTALFLKKTLEEKGIQVQDVLSKREGDIFGIHKIYFENPNEEKLCFTHQALDRKIFSRGALKAASWLVHQKPGLYNIKDCLQSPS